MHSVDPELNAPKVRFAASQPQYEAITAAVVRHPDFAHGETIVYAFRPSADELSLLAAGADLYLSLLTFGDAPQPVLLLAGKEVAAQIYGVSTSGVPGPIPGNCWPPITVVKKSET